MGSLLTTLSDWWASEGVNKQRAGDPNALNDKIAQFEHDANIAGLHQIDCIHDAKALLTNGQSEAARQRFAHAQSYKAQNLSLMKAVTAMHAQRVSITTHENNIRILETLKDTARQIHGGVSPAMVDRVTEDLNDANDYAVMSNGVMAGLGDELAPVHDEEWEQFVQEMSGASPDTRILVAPNEPSVPTNFPETPHGLPELPTKIACTSCGKLACTKCAIGLARTSTLVM
jgi:hypothetical protein